MKKGKACVSLQPQSYIKCIYEPTTVELNHCACSCIVLQPYSIIDKHNKHTWIELRKNLTHTGTYTYTHWWGMTSVVIRKSIYLIDVLLLYFIGVNKPRMHTDTLYITLYYIYLYIYIYKFSLSFSRGKNLLITIDSLLHLLCLEMRHATRADYAESIGQGDTISELIVNLIIDACNPLGRLR